MNKGTYSVFSGRGTGGIAGVAPIWESPDTGTIGPIFNQWSHGLNFRPKLYEVGLRCLSTDNGWSPGCELSAFSLTGPPTGALTFAQPSVYCTSTVIGFQQWDGSAAAWFLLPNGNANGVFTPVTSAWRPFARIFG